MRWGRALAAWFLIVVAESVHGTIRQLWIAPAMGDLPSRQLGVATGSVIIFLIAWATIGWIGARTTGDQVRVGLAWVVLIVLFEFGLGTALGYPLDRMLSDYNLARGGFMGLGLAFMVCAPALAARVRGQASG
jgi:hypothetical protein